MRRLCSPMRANVNAATAPSVPARPANTPNCTAHLVGVNVISSQPTVVVPISRHAGPVASPATPPRRSSTISTPNSDSSISSTAKRRVSEPSLLLSSVRKYRRRKS